MNPDSRAKAYSSFIPTLNDLIITLKNKGITQSKLLAAFQRVERDLFVPPEQAENAYLDQPLPISYGQTTNQPSLIAKMILALKLKGSERVLEIGTGMGFQTALLGCLCKEVYSLELNRDLVDQATANLRAAGIHNAFVFSRNGTLGLPFYAPFHAIIASTRFPRIPLTWAEQLKPGGMIVAPIGPVENNDVFAFRKLKKHQWFTTVVASTSEFK